MSLIGSMFGYGSEAVQPGKSMTLGQLREKGGTGEQKNIYQGQGILTVRDSAWFSSTVKAGTLFRVQVDGPTDKASVLFGKIASDAGFGQELVFAQPGDDRSPMRSATFVATGTRIDTISVQAGSSHIETTQGKPTVETSTLKFFVGDDSNPIPVYVNGADEPTLEFKFNPLTDSEAKYPNRLQNIRVTTLRNAEGGYALKVQTHVDPSCVDLCSDAKAGCMSGTKTVFDTTVAGVKNGVSMTGTGLKTAAWSVAHPRQAMQSVSDAVVRALGGTPAEREEIVDFKKEE